MSRLLLVSNRLPVAVRRAAGKARVETAGAGGLVAGLGPIHHEGEGLWFGTLSEAEDPAIAAQLEARRLVAVDVPREDARRHYVGFSNSVLWPLFHYLQDRVRLSAPDWEAYVRVNQRFADAIAERARPGDSIWVHDYHFLLLPAMLRRRLPDAPIGFFSHIPFPSSEVFRLLPQREAILKGMLGANLVGLHTYDYARHLVSSCRRLLGVDFDQDWTSDLDHRCRVGVFPMGIDVVGFRERVDSPRVPRLMSRLRKGVDGRKLVLGIDRLDYTKGLPLKVQAYRRLLERYPRWRTDAVFIQIANPTRSDIAAYKSLKARVEQMVGELNGAFETDGQVPIHYLYRSYPPDTVTAYYRLADVALVTPLRDGMNLVAKEYVSCRSEDTGVLVLSEFAGAASEMGEALQVNPWDVEGTAEAIHAALEMPSEEQARRMRGLRRRIEASDVRGWAPRFLAHLAAVHRDGLAARRPVGSRPWTEELPTAFRRARRRLLVLDHDGTLARLAPAPDMATPAASLLTLLSGLADQPGTEIALASSRGRKTLESWYGRLPLHLIGQHGCELRLAGEDTWQTLLPDADESWMPRVRDVLEDYAARTPGAWVESKRGALAWHYRQVEPGFGRWQARELASHLAEAFPHSPMEVIHGARVVEVRHQGLHKGAALTALLRQRPRFDFLLVAGDDRSDEDMFAAVPESAWTIKIGPGPSRARFRLARSMGLRTLLEHLDPGPAEDAEGPPPVSTGGGR